MKKHTEKRELALKMRNEGVSLTDICNKLRLGKTTVYYWIKDIKINYDKSEVSRKSWKQRRVNEELTKVLKPINPLYNEKLYASFAASQRGNISAAAIFYRLCAFGFSVFSPVFDGERVDVVVESPSKKLIKIQIKSLQQGKFGQPLLSLRRNFKNRKILYVKGEFDFIIGYGFKHDEAYVFSWEETQGYRANIAVTEDSKEAWQKLISFV